MRYWTITGSVLMLLATIPPLSAQWDPWSDFRFLIGTWVGVGSPEAGTSRFTLAEELQGKVLVRRNWTDLPAGGGRPATHHEDLMVIYPAPGGNQIKATYFDNEGHVIHYTVSPLPGQTGLTFVSDAEASAPRFRLTYLRAGEDTLSIQFEIAPPGKPEEFKIYLEGKAVRTTRD